MTFCPSRINEKREVVFPARDEFLSYFVIVLYFDVAYFSECWVVHVHKFFFTFLVYEKSHEKVIGLIQILDFCTFNGSYYFAFIIFSLSKSAFVDNSRMHVLAYDACGFGWKCGNVCM